MSGNVEIGRFVVVHINSTIGHDCILGDYCQVNPGSNISGFCRLKEKSLIGTEVRIIPNICIGNSTIIGAGAVVTTDIPDGSTAVGIPAKVIKK